MAVIDQNREGRRKYLKKVHNDKMSSICPKCGKKCKHYTVSNMVVPYAVDVKCEYCGAIVARNIKNLTPRIYVRLVTA